MQPTRTNKNKCTSQTSKNIECRVGQNREAILSMCHGETSHGEEYVIDRSLIFRLYNIITQIQASHGGTSANLTKFTS